MSIPVSTFMFPESPWQLPTHYTSFPVFQWNKYLSLFMSDSRCWASGGDLHSYGSGCLFKTGAPSLRQAITLS